MQAFLVAACLSSTPSPRSPSHQLPRQPPPHKPSTPEHPLLSRACRRWGSQAQPEPGTPPLFPFPQHRRARTGAARRRGTRRPQKVLLPPSCHAFLSGGGGSAGFRNQEGAIPARLSTCPSDPYALSGQLAGNSKLRVQMRSHWADGKPRWGLETGGPGDSENGGRHLCRGHKST